MTQGGHAVVAVVAPRGGHVTDVVFAGSFFSGLAFSSLAGVALVVTGAALAVAASIVSCVAH